MWYVGCVKEVFCFLKKPWFDRPHGGSPKNISLFHFVESLKMVMEVPVNKGFSCYFRRTKKVEVRYRVAEKFGFGGVCVVSLHPQ